MINRKRRCITKITADQIIEWDPCDSYTESQIRELVGDGVTPEEVIRSSIPTEDKIWVLLHEPILTEYQLHTLACDFADQALASVNDPDPRSVEVIRVKRLWINGQATDNALTAAARDAVDVAWSASQVAAWAAASAAARAAWSAAWSAARIAWVAAGEVASQLQLQMIENALHHEYPYLKKL